MTTPNIVVRSIPHAKSLTLTFDLKASKIIKQNYHRMIARRIIITLQDLSINTSRRRQENLISLKIG